MKKNLKLGFSLSEILIALAIISIISTMGITVARRGVDKAYNLYVYTSYSGIANAINYANMLVDNDGTIDTDDNPNTTETNNALTFLNPFDSGSGEPTEYLRAILQALSATDVTYPADSAVEFSTPNSVKYKITRYRTDYIASGTNFDPEHVADYIISVTIPKRKTKTSSTNTYCLLYRTNTTHELLIPFDNELKDSSNNVVCKVSDDLKNLATKRMDLLPVYIDNGSAGRRVPSDTGTSSYTKRVYTTLADAYCKTNDFIDIEVDSTTILHCSSGTAEDGTVLVVSPKNL